MTFNRLNSTLPNQVVGFFLLSLVAGVIALPSVSISSSLDFTDEEQAWLDSHPTVRVGPAPDFPPVEFFNEDGKFSGMAAEYLELIKELVPAEFEVQHLESWGEVVSQTREGNIDIWLEAAQTPERDQFMLFSEPYIKLPAVIIAKHDLQGPLTLQDLQGMRIVGIEGYATLDYIRSVLPDADVDLVPDIPTGLQHVAYGSADAIVVGNGPASYYIEKMGLTNLHAVGESGFVWRLSLGVRRELPLLHSILAKAIAEIDEEQHRSILRRWTYLGEPSGEDATGLNPILIAFLVVIVLGLVVFLARRDRPAADTLLFMSENAAQTGRNWPFYLGIATAVIVVLGFSYYTQRIFVQQARQDVGRSLQGVLNTTSLSVDSWLAEQQEMILNWSRHAEVRDVAVQLFHGRWQGPSADDVLIEQLETLLESDTYQGFLLVDSEGSFLASSTPNSRGVGRSISTRSRQFIEELLESGDETGVLLPFKSVEADSGGARTSNLLKVAAAIRDEDGRGLGALVVTLDPNVHFTQILQRGRMGESGESYAFNRDGKLISESRFDDDLRAIGLIPRGERGILQVDVRDPGGNMVEGFRPQREQSSLPLTHMANEAIAGRPGMSLDAYNDYRGVPVIGAWTWNESIGLGVTTEIDHEEAYNSLETVKSRFMVVTGVTLTLILAMAVFFQVDKRRRQILLHQILASEERTKSLLNSTPDPMVIVDDKGVMLFVNGQATKMLEYEAAELIGQSVEILVPDRVRDAHPAMREAFIADPKPINMYDRHGMAARTKSGREIPISLSLNPIEIEGDSLLVAAALRDETERNKAREQLDLRAAALKAADNGIVITGSNGIIQWVNPAFSELTGFEFDEVIGKNPRIINSGVHDAAFFEEMWQVIMSGAVWFGEVVNKRKDGTHYTEEMTITPVSDEGGDIIHFVAIKQDITERKEMEIQLDQARLDAESANRAKSSFLANMSHELRTPMNAIIGYSEMLIEDAEDEGQDDMVSDLKKIHASGNHLLNLINDILDLSKVEAGRMDLYLESFGLKEMLEESLGSLEPLVAKNANTLVTEFPEDLGMVRADLTKVRQALFNLVSNAAKFTDQGTITIAAGRERAEDGDTFRIDVTDTGIGIPEDKIDRVFEEFGQADESTTKEYGGTGLGLPISRKFCQMMGGDITVTSAPGVGSTFSITLPTQVDAMEAAKSAASESTAADEETAGDATVGKNSILIIDDDPNARELLSRTLDGDGYTVITAKDGQEGLLLAKDNIPSVITLDVQMPGMDGWAVLKTLKADPNLREIPVIMVSIVGDQQTGNALGAVESLSKPVDREALLGIVSRYMASEEVGKALVIEDDADNRSLLARTLRKAGWQVMEAENGAVGLEQVAAVVPDLILLDLMMPVMDGFDFVLELRNTEEWREIPIIVVTAKDLTKEDRFRLTGGVETIIQKGAFSKEKFLGEINHLVRKGNRTGDATGDEAEREK